MPDQTIVDASKTFIDTGVIGSALVLVIGALCFVVHRLLKTQDAMLALSEKRVEDGRDFVEASMEFKAAIQANTEAMKTALDFMRDRTRV